MISIKPARTTLAGAKVIFESGAQLTWHFSSLLTKEDKALIHELTRNNTKFTPLISCDLVDRTVGVRETEPNEESFQNPIDRSLP